MTEQSHTYKFGDNVEKIVRVAHCAEQETTFNALIRHDIELDSPYITKLVNDIEKHEIGKRHDCKTYAWHFLKLDACGISFV